MKVIIADDDDGIAFVLAEFFADIGCAVRRARDGAEVIRLVQDDCPDLVMVDMVMPVMDGGAVARQLRANPATADLPIILASAQSRAQLEAQRLPADVVVLAKPFDLNVLLSYVHRLVGATDDPAAP